MSERLRPPRTKPELCLTFYSRPAAEWFDAMFGKYSEGKHLPDAIHATHGILPIVAGWIDGDGSQRKAQGKSVCVNTVSETLARQMRQILLDHGVWCTLNRQDQKPQYIPHSNSYVAHRLCQWIITVKASFLHLLPPCKIVVPNDVRFLRRVIEDEAHFFPVIQRIDRAETALH